MSLVNDSRSIRLAYMQPATALLLFLMQIGYSCFLLSSGASWPRSAIAVPFTPPRGRGSHGSFRFRPSDPPDLVTKTRAVLWAYARTERFPVGITTLPATAPVWASPPSPSSLLSLGSSRWPTAEPLHFTLSLARPLASPLARQPVAIGTHLLAQSPTPTLTRPPAAARPHAHPPAWPGRATTPYLLGFRTSYAATRGGPRKKIANTPNGGLPTL